MNKEKVMSAELVASEIRNHAYFFDSIEHRKRFLADLLNPDATENNENCFVVLRRWNSYTPSMVIHSSTSKGGGYFLKWQGIGVVIDPGFNFIENFHDKGFRMKDIHAVVITHAHIDHCVEIEAILTLLFEYNEAINEKNEESDQKNSSSKMENHKISLYMNLSTYKKYGDWITSCHNKYIRKIHILESGLTFHIDKSSANKASAVQLDAVNALHSEIWNNQYSVGLIFRLFKDGEEMRSIGITGDTRWNPSIEAQYKDCNIVVVHLGGIKEYEINSIYSVTDEKRLYKNHLGVLGVSHMLQNLLYSKDSTVKWVIISEFGEELKDIRKEFIDLIKSHVQMQIECRVNDQNECIAQEWKKKCNNIDSEIITHCGECALEKKIDNTSANIQNRKHYDHYRLKRNPGVIRSRLKYSQMNMDITSMREYKRFMKKKKFYNVVLSDQSKVSYKGNGAYFYKDSKINCAKDAYIQKHKDCMPKCIIGDIGTRMNLNPMETEIELTCEYKDCKREARPDDILMSDQSIAHYCQEHTPLDVYNELTGLL